MLKVDKCIEPDFLIDFKNKNLPKVWSDYNNFDIKAKIKEYILNNEQREYCVYCENRIYERDRD